MEKRKNVVGEKLPELKPMTAKDFAITFKRDSRAGERFCFILGSGASRNSGIKTGREMIDEWRREILTDCDGDMDYIRRAAERIGYRSQDWEEIFQSDYQVNSRHYFVMYDLMYADTLRAGYGYMQKAMSKAKPSIGYYCLASILDSKENGSNLVITTNFDTLTEDALFFLSGKHPLVLGHERMASFLRSDIDRPVVAKIHRDMLLEPKSRQKEMKRLEIEWEKALRSILPSYVPIVVGYAGGDNTLMNLLKKEDLECRKIYWCTHTSEKVLDKDVETVIRNLKGQWVRIDGFDQLLYQMSERLKLVPNEVLLEQSSQERIQKFRDTYEEFIIPNMKPVTSGDTKPAEQAMDVAKAITREETRRNPDRSNYIFMIVQAWNLWHKGQKDEAVAKLTEAIHSNSNATSALSARSIMYHNMSCYTEALQDINRAIELEPVNAQFYYSRGVTFHEMKRYEEALADKNRAIELEPDNAQFYNSRGVTLHEMKRYDEALADKNRAIELELNNARFYDSRSATLREMKRYDEALGDINEAIKLNPDNAELYGLKAALLRDMGHFSEAEDCVDNALKMDSENAYLYGVRSRILIQKGKLKDAKRDADRSIEINPQEAIGHFAMSEVLYEMKIFPDALVHIDKALESWPSENEYKQHRQRILDAMNSSPFGGVPALSS